MTPTSIQPAAQTAIDNFLSAKGRVERALATTAPDRVAWSPSPTSRTSAEIVAHLAFNLTGFTHIGTIFKLTISHRTEQGWL